MKKLLNKYRISGTGSERLLNILKKEGYILFNVRRKDKQCLEFSVPLKQAAKLEEYVQGLGFSYQVLPETGMLKKRTQLHKRKFLIVFCFFMLGFALLSLRFVWIINVSGAGIYRGEVNSWLRENNIRPLTLKSSINVQALCDGLLFRLPDIAWVRAQIQGVELKIEITEGIAQPKLASGSDIGNIVAACDGIIQSIDVFCGTAAASPGDLVKAGQLLIAGQERDAGENMKAVRASGKITAKIWKNADAYVDAVQTKALPTGRKTEIIQVNSPWGAVLQKEMPEYLTYEKEIDRIWIGGAWLPIWIDKIQYAEVSLEPTQLDPDQAKAEAGRLAMRKLLSLCGKNDEIIDKWLNFSMIEGDTIQATATAELIAEIGIFTPQISD